MNRGSEASVDHTRQPDVQRPGERVTAVRLPPRPRVCFCQECGQPFYPSRVDQVFCKNVCRMAQHDRERTHGRALYRLVKSWRLDRGKGALAELTQYADRIAGEERDRRRRHAEIREAAERELAR